MKWNDVWRSVSSSFCHYLFGEPFGSNSMCFYTQWSMISWIYIIKKATHPTWFTYIHSGYNFIAKNVGIWTVWSNYLAMYNMHYMIITRWLLMSSIKAVVEANDLILTRSHQEFRAWRKRQLETAKGKSKSLFRWALQHYNTSKRKITKPVQHALLPRRMLEL